MNGLHPTDCDDLVPSSPPGTPNLKRTPDLYVPNGLDQSSSQFSTRPPQVISRSAELFNQFSSEVIQGVLWSTNANGFASLCLLNSRWYHEAQSLALYAHHLSRCPSYALLARSETKSHHESDLLRVKARFAAEVCRNLFDAYLWPKETHINLISTCASSSAAFPTSEAFRFEFSPNGRRVLAVSSSRIYVLDATQEPVSVVRELKTVRRSLSASITDDGSLLAVLSSKYQANIYSLVPGKPVKHLQVIILDNPPRTIALAREGTVLAAAYEGAIEVFSLSRTAIATDRRSVRCEPVDSLTFSGDGSIIVGSSNNLEEPNAVVVTAPFYTENDPNVTPQEIHSRMWTTQMLFPQISSTVSHATLLSGHGEGDACWLFAFDHTLMTYRAVRTDDTRTGVVYFLSPSGEERFDDLAPNVPPSVTACGTLAVAGFERGGLFLYGIPDRLDLSPDMGSVVELCGPQGSRDRGSLTTVTGHLTEPLLAYSPSMLAENGEVDEDGLAGKVDWRESLFVRCRSISSIQGYNTVKWVEKTEDYHCGFRGHRLIVTAPAGVDRLGEDLGDEDMPVDGSRLCLLDFEYGPTATRPSEITIEVGNAEPELLTEQSGNMEVEVAMERRRTTRKNRTQHGTIGTQIGRAQTSTSSPISPRSRHTPLPTSPGVGLVDASPGAAQLSIPRAQSTAGYHQARFPPRPPLGASNVHNHHTQNTRPNRIRGGSQGSWETPPPPYTGEGVSYSPVPPVPRIPTQRITPSSIRTNVHPSGNPHLAGNTSQVLHEDPQVGVRTTVTDDIQEESGPAVLQSMYHHQAGMDSMDIMPRTINTLVTHSSSPQLNEVASEGDTLALRPNMIQPPSLPTSEHHGYMPFQNALPAAPVVRNEQNRLSLTGANLVNRLNHPTPPVPTETVAEEARSHPAEPMGVVSGRYISNSIMQDQQRQVPLYQNVPAAPSMEQLDRLNRRSMQQWSMSVPNHHTRSDSRDFADRSGPVPPRGAWGAAGVNGATSFNRAIATPDGMGLSRSGSRGSLRRLSSQGHSYASQTYHSTPNLVTQSVNARPTYQRLDTIESINSVYPLESTARSKSFDTRRMHGTDLPSSHHQQYGRPLTMTDRGMNSTFNSNASDGTKTAKKLWRKRDKNMNIEMKEKKVFRCTIM